MTDDLIARLVRDLKPVPAGAAVRLFLFVPVVALLVSATAMLAWLGPRPDFQQAVSMPIFWIKCIYVLLLGICGTKAMERAARPGASGGGALVLAGVVFAATAVAAGLDYAQAAPDARHLMLMGSSATVCPLLIVALSMPFLAAAFLVLRRLAPTRLGMAGASAGLMAGGLGAWVYSFHCTEPGLPFLATWYSLGVAAVVILGALCGRVLLRW